MPAADWKHWKTTLVWATSKLVEQPPRVRQHQRLIPVLKAWMVRRHTALRPGLITFVYLKTSAVKNTSGGFC